MTFLKQISKIGTYEVFISNLAKILNRSELIALKLSTFHIEHDKLVNG